MAESIGLFDERAAMQRKLAAEARKLEAEQQDLVALTDEFHQELRLAADEIGRKTVAYGLGVDLSTVSNWLSCESGRGFPPPRLVLFLGKRSDRLARWLVVQGWGYLPPEREHEMTAEEELRRIKAALAVNPDTERAIYGRAFGDRKAAAR